MNSIEVLFAKLAEHTKAADEQSLKLAALGDQLYSIRDQAVEVPLVDVSSPAFTPVAKLCHANASKWCELSPYDQPVHGWLYFDYAGVGPAMFMAHSVVRKADGSWIDITPQERHQAAYAFIPHGTLEPAFKATIAETDRVWHKR